MTTPRKKLIEVALPLEAINEESSRRKRKAPAGYPTTLHKWWAQRPLAACRAVLFASLVDDPDSDPKWRRPDGTVDEEKAANERARLFDLIEDLVQWENSNNPVVVEGARAEIARCVASRKVETGELKKDAVIFGPRKGQAHSKGPVSGEGVTAWDVVCRQAPPNVVNAFLAEHAPPVLDPFCGGGSIPLEAQRLGLVAHASDLNPVAVLITKALIEIPPKFAGRPPVNPEARKKPMATYHGATGLAADVRYYGEWVRSEAEKRIGHLYPKVKVTVRMTKERADLAEYEGEELAVIAWLWARTVSSPNPAARGAHVPLVSSLMLCTKEGRKSWVEIVRDSSAPDGWRFQVRSGVQSREVEAKAKSGTKAGKAKDFMCALCNTPIDREYIQAEGKADRLRVRLMAVVCEGRRGRVFLSPDRQSEATASSAIEQPIVEESLRSFLSGATPTRAMVTGGVCSAYGLRTWGHLFTARQIVALTTFSDLVQQVVVEVRKDGAAAGFSTSGGPLRSGGAGAEAYSDAICTYLAMALSRVVDYNTSLTSWRAKDNAMRSTLTKQALPMIWDFAEANPFERSSSGLLECAKVVAKCVELLSVGPQGQATQLDARVAAGHLSGVVASTDPPYYDNISYAEFSDFQYIWLRRSLMAVYPDLFGTLLTPKTAELIKSAIRHGGSEAQARAFFEEGLQRVFEQLRSAAHSDYPVSVYYAFKQAESGTETEEDEGQRSAADDAPVSTGWETMLEGLVRAAFFITGTWPMRTEGDNRQVGLGANALASSIVLVCRPRLADAPTATRKEFLTALRAELPDALRNLQRGNIAPVDLAQASIGPGMAVFTRFARVLESDGSPMRVRTALQLINQALDEVLAEQEGEFDGDTRWALAWFEQYGMDEGPFGTAETLSKAKNTGVNALAQTGLVTARGGKVRLVARGDLPPDWSPPAGGNAPVWEATQHLIRTLDQQGESAAADLLRKLGGAAETARDLAYRLYTVCERKKWAEEALAYNGLVIAWPELLKLAQAAPKETPVQKGLFE